MHTILHIGAGQASELSQWLESGAQNIVLVEPNPILAEKLRKQTADTPEITVLEAAITTNAGDNELSEYNLPEASSLRAATGLKTLFPGLKIVSIHTVATLTPLQLMEQYGPTPGQPATLALQAPGEEYSILQALAETDQLKLFSQLVITANPEPLCQGSTDAQTLLNTLEKYGYDIIRENQQDPDWPTWYLQRNPLKDQISQLQQQLQTAQEENQQVLAEQKQANAEREHALEQQLNAVNQKLTHADSAFSAKVHAEHAARKQLNQLRDELRDKSQRIEDIEEANQDLKQELDAAKSSNTDLNEENSKLNSQTQSLEAESQNVKTELKASKQLIEAAQQETEQLRDAVKSSDQKAETLHERLKQAEQKAQQVAENLKKEQSVHQETTKSLADHKQWFQSRKQQAEELQAQNDTLKQQLETVNQEKQHVQVLEQKLKDEQQIRQSLGKARDAAKEQAKAAEQSAIAAQRGADQLGTSLHEREGQLQKSTRQQAEAEKQLTEQQQKLAEETKILNNVREQLEQQKAEAFQQQSELERSFALKEELKTSLDLEKAARKTAEKALSEEQETSKTIKQKLEEERQRKQSVEQQLQATGTRFDQMEKKLSDFGNNFNNQLDKKLINAAKQIESTLGLQNYLSTGELPLSYHGWPISPDLALYLTEKLETENYDLVIEFGSGTSTVLFAKVLMKKMLRQQTAEKKKRISNQDRISQIQEPLEDALLPVDVDLPKRVLTFEHNKSYHEQTMGMLRQAGLEQVVNLVHSPLLDYSYQGEDYLYYDCDSALKKIAEVYEGREPKILVLVDGPPGATGPNARFPALPKLLNHLSTATFEVILDDYNRSKEKAVAEKWIELIKKRSSSYNETKISLEKGAVCISIGVPPN
jgi:FkbM family methyltransferase